MIRLILIVTVIFIIYSCGKRRNIENGPKCEIKSSYYNWAYWVSIKSSCKDPEGEFKEYFELINIIDSVSFEVLKKGGGFSQETDALVKGCEIDPTLTKSFDSLKFDLRSKLIEINKKHGDTKRYRKVKRMLDEFLFLDKRLMNENYLKSTSLAYVYNDLVLLQSFLWTNITDCECIK